MVIALMSYDLFALVTFTFSPVRQLVHVYTPCFAYFLFDEVNYFIFNVYFLLIMILVLHKNKY